MHTLCVHPRVTRLALHHLDVPVVLTVALVTHRTEVALVDQRAARLTQREVVCPLVGGKVAGRRAAAAATLDAASAQLQKEQGLPYNFCQTFLK